MNSKTQQITYAIRKVISKIGILQRSNPSNSRETHQKIETLKSKIASEVLPGQGFFACQDVFALVAPINSEINEIEITIEAPKDQILNLDQVNLIGHGGKILDKTKIITEAQLSSMYKNKSRNDLLTCVQTGKGMIHTNREPRPSLKLKLDKSNYLQSIVIKNRNDKNGRRSKFLVVRTYNNNAKISEYINCSRERAKALISELCDASSVSLEHLSEGESASSLTAKLKEGIKGALANGLLDWDARKLIQLLPIYEKNPEITEFHEYVLSIIFLKLLGSAGYFGTKSLIPLSPVLRNHKTIKNVLDQASLLSESVTKVDSQIVLSKHSLNRSRLQQKRDQYLTAIREAVNLFKRLEVDLILFYGTLLGAIREDDFIAHDDDVDLMIINAASSEAEALEKKDQIIAALRKLNIRVLDIRKFGFHIILNKCNLDIFICWENGGGVSLQMERFKIRTIPSRILQPASTIKFRGIDFPAPAQPEEFLRERYGENWDKSDPYHEFPWKVKM